MPELIALLLSGISTVFAITVPITDTVDVSLIQLALGFVVIAYGFRTLFMVRRM